MLRKRIKYLIGVVEADLYRHHGATGLRGFIRTYVSSPCFRYVVWMRMAAAFRGSGFLLVPYSVSLWVYYRLGVRHGINVPHTTSIGPGFLIGHSGGIVVNADARIGRDFSLSHGVTIGQKNRGRYKGSPTIGDAVYVGPGACIIGSVSIGSNVAVGANAVVVNDVGDNEVVVGVPARSVSREGAQDYVTWTLGSSPSA
jgi:serine O-acetyltransferase